MNKWFQLGNFVEASLKGITPKYIDKSDVIVLNQKCIRNNKIDYSFSQFHDPSKTFNDKKILRIGDLLFNSTGQGTAGRCAFVRNLPTDKKVITDSHILIIRIDDYYLAECFSYSFYKEEKFIQSFLDGSTGQGELDKLRLFNVEFRLPEKSNRKGLCEFFNSIDQKIELNNQVNAELEGLAKLVYDYWFVQFDFPDENGKPYKAYGGKMVYNKMLKREIPEGWGVGVIADLIKNDKSGDWGKESDQGNYVTKVSCVRGADINGINGKGNVKTPTRFILEKNEHKILEPFDLVVEISGGSPVQSTGRLTYMTKSTLERFENPLICSNFCKALTLKDPNYIFNFVFNWNRLYDADVLFGWEGKTSGIKNLLFENFVNAHKIVIPDPVIVKYFYDFYNPIQNKIQTNLKENQELSEFRDWLLPMFMNGQVKVKEASNYGTYEVEEDLGMVAENEPVYGKEEKLEDLFPTLNYDFELAAVVLLTEQRFNCNYGKKYFHKMFSNMQFLASLPKINELQFTEKGWGMFSKGLAHSIDNAFHISKSRLDNGHTVYKVKSSNYKEITSWINDTQNKLFVDEVNTMLSIYEHQLIKKDMDRIELLNTVLECIKVLDTYKFPLIYNKMKTWKMEEPEFEYKANKFKPEETMHMVALVRELKC